MTRVPTATSARRRGPGVAGTRRDAAVETATEGLRAALQRRAVRPLAVLPADAGTPPGVRLARDPVRATAARRALAPQDLGTGARSLGRARAEPERAQRCLLAGELLGLAPTGAVVGTAVAGDEGILEIALALADASATFGVRPADALLDPRLRRSARHATAEESGGDCEYQQAARVPARRPDAQPGRDSRVATVVARAGRLLLIIIAGLVVTLSAGAAGAAMHGGGGGGAHGMHASGGWHHSGWGGHGWHGHGPHVFIDGGFFFGAPLGWGWPYYYGDPYYPYPPAYVYPPYGVAPYSYYPPPPPPEGTEQEAESAPPEGGASAPTAPATYGLVRLRGVRDGSSVDLDGRFWLTAERLDDRWLALPEGTHTITVRDGDAPPVTRQVTVNAGGNLNLDF
jgi:hypothetical protein